MIRRNRPQAGSYTYKISSCKFFRDRIREVVNASFHRLNHGLPRMTLITRIFSVQSVNPWQSVIQTMRMTPAIGPM